MMLTMVMEKNYIYDLEYTNLAKSWFVYKVTLPTKNYFKNVTTENNFIGVIEILSHSKEN